MTALTVHVSSPAGDLARTVELPASVFDVTVNVPLIHQVVVAQLAAARQGTHDTKTRGEVSGGGRKPYRQKGTGRARQGSTRAPQFAGGGVVHGPTPRDYSQRTPKKMKAAALRGALSDRARHGRVHVVAGLVDGEVPSTKLASRHLAEVAASRHVLVVAERHDKVAWKSLRNVDHVHLIAPDQLNTYDVLVSDDVVFTEGALAVFLAGPVGGGVGATDTGLPADEPAPSAESVGDAVSALAAGAVEDSQHASPAPSPTEEAGA
jgi:large subunit ribosomal protein L4